MEAVFQYDIPVLHPLAVHFPLGLLLAGGLVALLWLARGTAFWRRAVLLFYGLGLIGAVFAYVTGEAMEEQSEGVPIVEELLELHEDAAVLVLVLAGATTAVLAGLSFWLERRITLERAAPDPWWVRIVGTLLALAASLAVAWAGHIGGTMVWGVAP